MKSISNDKILREVGAGLAIIAWISAQFVEVTLYQFGQISISVQKLVAIIIFPYSVFLMGKLKLNKHLIGFAIMLSFVYTLGHIANRGVFSKGLAASTTGWLQLLGALVLFTSLNEKKHSIVFFGKVWIYWSFVTSIITFLQSAGFIPLINVPYEYLGGRLTIAGMYRGVGLKFDPNFQAMMLLIGLVFSLILLNGLIRILCFTIIMLGIFSTFSRMGLLLSIISFITVPSSYSLLEKRVSVIKVGIKAFLFMILITLLVLLSLYISPASVRNYMFERFDDISHVIKFLIDSENFHYPDHLTSGFTRFLLAWASIKLALHYWATGIGAHNTEFIISEFIGLKNVSHNTYIEFFLIGGVWGLVLISYYFYVSLLWLKRRTFNAQSFLYERVICINLIIIFALLFNFLSLTYNSILWLPLTISVFLNKLLKNKGKYEAARNTC